MKEIKLKRIGSQISQELMNIIECESHDNILKSITITAVDVSSDLGVAKVYFTSLLEEEPKIIEKNLNDSTASFLRSNLAERIEIRHIPKLVFKYDTSVDYGNKIEKIIKEIHEKS